MTTGVGLGVGLESLGVLLVGVTVALNHWRRAAGQAAVPAAGIGLLLVMTGVALGLSIEYATGLRWPDTRSTSHRGPYPARCSGRRRRDWSERFTALVRISGHTGSRGRVISEGEPG